jgi:transposase-like protein
MNVTIVEPFKKKLKGKELEIVDMYYNQQHTMLYISQYFDCSRDILRNFFKNNNLEIRNIQETQGLMRKHRPPKMNFNFGDYKFIHKNVVGLDEHIRKLYNEEEYSINEIAKKYNVSNGVIHKWLIKNNISIRDNKESRNASRYYESQRRGLEYKFDESKIVKIISLYQDGYSRKFIAKEIGVDSDVIKRILLSENILLRSVEDSRTDKTSEVFANTIYERFGGWKGRHDIQKEKSLEKYGVENPMQVEEFFNRQQKSAKMYKTAMVEGVEITYQGYELKAIYRLLSEGYHITDIKNGKDNVPNFLYNFDGKNRRYYPDIYIPKDNRIIEVKSLWYYESELEKNLAKRDAVEKKNYKFDFYIMEK